MLQPILVAAEKLGLTAKDVISYGDSIVKIKTKGTDKKENGKIVLVTAIHPTEAGEGKTTISIGLIDALSQLKSSVIGVLREPSLGPCFGRKGGATGGGQSSVVPVESIDLHFTGDFHAITAAHNLIAACLDNHLYFGNELNIDPKKILWGRTLDVNDRGLRNIRYTLKTPSGNIVRTSHFDITAASEIMAIFCLATSWEDLDRRLGNIVIAYSKNNEEICVRDLKINGALLALLKDAFLPNLVQTKEENPVIIHGGPFANIACGASSLTSLHLGKKLADIVVTEAGFGTDLGGEKFIDIVSQKGNLKVGAGVLVATVRSLKMQGGQSSKELTKENISALQEGLPHLKQHIDLWKKFGITPTIALNCFASDTPQELEIVKDYCKNLGVKVAVCSVWQQGGKGALELARYVQEALSIPTNIHPTYTKADTIIQKMEKIGTTVYGAKDIKYGNKAKKVIDSLQKSEYAHFPICVAKTPSSFSDNPSKLGVPKNFTMQVTEVRLLAGAELIVMLCGGITTLPGLPRKPLATSIYVNDSGEIIGLD